MFQAILLWGMGSDKKLQSFTLKSWNINIDTLNLIFLKLSSAELK